MKKLNSSTTLLSNKKYNLMFFLSILIASFITFLVILKIYYNTSDLITLFSPVLLLLIPVYLIIRFVFIKLEINKTLEVNKTLEINKFLFFISLLFILATKIFPLYKDSSISSLLYVKLFSFDILNSFFYSMQDILINFIKNLLIFIPLGIFIPAINNKLNNLSSCMLLSFIVSLIISLTQISLEYIGFYTAGIISLDFIFINMIGCLLGYIFYKYYSSLKSKLK